MRVIVKFTILFLLITLNLNATETCKYKASPTTPKSSWDSKIYMYPQSDGIHTCAYLKPSSGTFTVDGRVEVKLDGVKTALSYSLADRDKTFIYYKKGDGNTFACFKQGTKGSISVEVRDKVNFKNKYHIWTLTKDCPSAKPADLITSAPSIQYESGLSHTYPYGKIKGFITVKNIGEEASLNRIKVKYYLSKNSSITTSDTELDYDRVNSLNANGVARPSEYLYIPSTTKSGTYYFGACTDSFSGEANTNNNCSSSVKVIIKDALTVSNVASEMTLGQTYKITLRNNMKSTAMKMELYRNGRFVKTIYSTTPPVSNRNFTIKDVSAGSNYYLRVTSLNNSNIYKETNRFTIKQGIVKRKLKIRLNNNHGTIKDNHGQINCPSDCEAEYDDNTQVILTATPKTGYAFLNNSGIATCTNENPCTFKIVRDLLNVSTTFSTYTAQQLQVNVTDIGGASGQVSSSPSGITACRANNQGTCSASFTNNVVLTAHPEDNSKVEFIGCSRVNGNDCTVSMGSVAKNVGVKFTPIKQKLTLAFDSVPQTVELNPNEKLSIDFKVTTSPSSDNIIDKLQIDQYGDRSNIIDCKTNFDIKDVVTCEVSYPVIGNYTLTATAYDESMTSNMLSLPIIVTNGENRNKYTGHQNPEYLKMFWTNNPQTSKEAFYVDTATGTQNLQLNFLQQFGQIDLNLGITYNSGLAKDSSLGHLGKGWGHGYGMLAKIEKINNSKVLLHWSDTRQTLFVKGVDGIYRSRTKNILPNYYDELTVIEDGYELKKNSLTKYKFNHDGQLVHIVNSKGEKLFLSYINNRLFQILEPISGIRLKYYYNADGSINHVEDVVGHTISFVYRDDKLVEITDSDGTVHSFDYNDYGELTSYYINKGRENFRYFTNTFDELGRVTSQTTKSNHVTRFAYDESSANIIKTTITTPRGNSRKYKYNSKFQLLEFRDELNKLTINTYTNSGLLHTTKNPKGLITEHFYNAYGKLSKTLYPNGNRIDRGYNDGGAGHIDTIRDESIYTIKKYHYEGDLVKKVELNVEGDVKTIISNVYTYHYPYPDDTTTKVIRSIVSTTAKGNKTTTVYDKGRVSSVTTPEGVKTVYVYNDTGTLKEQKLYNKSGTYIGRTKFEYDQKGRVTKVIDAEGHTISKTYSVFGGIKKLIDAKGYSTENFYDLEGNVVQIKDAKNNFSFFTYNEEGQLLNSTDAEGHKHYISYDVKGRKEFEFNHDKQRVAEYDYDSLDALKRLYAYDDTNQKRLVSEHSYDIPNRTSTSKSYLSVIPREKTEYFDTRGRLIKYLNSANKTKTFNYENHFNTLLSVKNEIDEISSQMVDNEGNIKTLTDTNTNQTSFQNDSTPNITEEKSALNKIHQSTYNAHQLLEKQTNARQQEQVFTYYANGWLKTLRGNGVTWRYIYDANGNVLTITGTDGTVIKRTYDELNRVKTYTDTLGDTQSYTYDKVGNLLTLTYPDGKKATYLYDSENRIKSVAFDGKKLVDYTYTRTGKLKTQKWANGITRSYVYHNSVGELQSISDTKADATVLLAFTFEYDALGNIVKETKTINGETETFEHKYNDIGTLQESKVGSLNKAHYSSFAPVMLYDKDNRVKSIDGQTVSYDDDGNMLNYRINTIDRVLEFDAFGRLTKANNTVHRYDIENNKVKTIHNAKSTKFTINPNAKLSQLLVETKANGDKIYHIYGIGLVASISDNKTSYYHFDYRGSTVALSNSSGKITDTYKYLPYGKMVNHQGRNKTRFLYVGKYGIEKEVSGLYYMRARYYDADLKRFVSKDELVGSIENSKSLNRYAYVEGNPVMLIDPSGLMGKLSNKELEKEYYLYSMDKFKYNTNQIIETSVKLGIQFLSGQGAKQLALKLGVRIKTLSEQVSWIASWIGFSTSVKKITSQRVIESENKYIRLFQDYVLLYKNIEKATEREIILSDYILNEKSKKFQHPNPDITIRMFAVYKSTFNKSHQNYSSIESFNESYYYKVDERVRMEYCSQLQNKLNSINPNAVNGNSLSFLINSDINRECQGQYSWANPYNR